MRCRSISTVAVVGAAAAWAVIGSSECRGAQQIIDGVDPVYGAKVRQLRRDEGHEHSLYDHRDPWNADGSRMVGIWSDLQQRNWRVVLYDGDGRFLQELFPITRYDWRLVGDRHDNDVLYTWKGSNLYRFNVRTGDAELLKSFAPLALKPNGPSLNQAGDRILAVTSDGAFRSYRLPDMDAERAFRAGKGVGGRATCFGPNRWPAPAATSGASASTPTNRTRSTSTSFTPIRRHLLQNRNETGIAEHSL